MININHKLKKDKGFVILFAVVVSSIILAITLSMINISFKELSFSISGRASNDAFYGADTGVECALFWDKEGVFGVASSTTNPFVTTCANTAIDISLPALNPNGVTSWDFVLLGLGSSLKSCAKVNVTKDTSIFPNTTVIISKGYDIGDALCASTNPNRLERVLKVEY